MSSTLGVSCAAYVPYAFMNLLTPIISAIFGYIGFTIVKMTEAERAQAQQELVEEGETFVPINI